MNTNRSNCVPFTRAAFETLSAVALAAPSNRGDFLSACECAGVLDLVRTQHSLSVIWGGEVEDEFNERLDEIFDPVVIAGVYEFPHSRVLREMDEQAYREALREYVDSVLVEHGYCYYRKDELDALDRMDVLATLTAHCVEQCWLTEEQAEQLSSADTPMAFVAALKANCFLTEAVSRPRETARRRM
ncbi:hypothetical protein GXB84_09870 [Stenotrophomonas acidaminiphila]|uniref:hypothetical protein n=1 Tax=Stenotrophomonas acidaminiphila TaxID=128780 RepID=UPI00137632C6|nr:hypothetical protein [Stenotrophomonas acidaminiphila]MBH1744850.1 hypothetical protein [Stenotrophomonas maltophilia]MPS33967.1 hypothetical protein [Stenotrophomonas sp.]NCT87638.1 hypothetical protein [Stenotrophomonas acidaminiphila]